MKKTTYGIGGGYHRAMTKVIAVAAMSFLALCYTGLYGLAGIAHAEGIEFHNNMPDDPNENIHNLHILDWYIAPYPGTCGTDSRACAPGQVCKVDFGLCRIQSISVWRGYSNVLNTSNLVCTARTSDGKIVLPEDTRWGSLQGWVSAWWIVECRLKQ